MFYRITIPFGEAKYINQPNRSYNSDIQFFFSYTENASRFCHANGTWDSHANYDHCNHIEDTTDGSDQTQNIVIATHIYSAGYTLSLVALGLGLAVFIHFK